MATGHEQRVAWQLDGLLAGGAGAGLADGQLLERFATAEGPAAELAFAAIVERHGAMVLRVCEAVAGNRHDAEDAFQATFLVLARKGRSLWVADSIGPWLHQVALRTARGARVATARRRRHEDALATRTEAAGGGADGEDADHRELARILHEEIGRLPDHYRVPVVLCDLEGQTQEQAARHAGLPLGTVKSRLRRGRERLRLRLIGRGISPSAGAALHAIPPGLDRPLPDALIRSTTAAALRAASLRTLAGTSAGLLAQGVISAMSRSNWWKAGAAFFVAATVSGAGLAAGRAASGPAAASAQRPGGGGEARVQPKPPAEVAVLPAVPVHFRVNVSGRGQVAVANPAKVAADVDSPLAVVSLQPEGTRVKKGDVVVELDSSALRDQFNNQEVATRTAEAAHQNARTAREVAEVALEEYTGGIYPQDRAAAFGEIKLAEGRLSSTHARLDRVQQARQKLRGIMARKDHEVTAGDIVAELDLDERVDQVGQDELRGKMGLEVAQDKLNRLEKHTRPATIKALQGEIEKARSNERVKEAAFRLEKEKQARLAAKLRNCKLLAPLDGYVSYATHAAGPWPEKGRIVGPRQHVFTVVDVSGPMEVAARLLEPTIHRVTEGQKVDIHVDALPEKRFAGTVTRVPNGPDETRTAPGKHVYTTMIRIEGTDESLRPGMTAEVDVLVADHPNALVVPHAAVIGRDTPYRLAVKQPDGRVEIREVILGDADESRVEVKVGLKPGEQVVLQPASLLGETEAGQGGR
ncbi:ECF RNA polymerase sigma factor SigE [Aquisphaera giovannonii]|uniref:ECF RNA polymerase sigma factor SigE n=1 Tax=Aquisphaera giovannonii TaxID=406548 RepID=A0A5B9VVI9_9BACT|nr:efflux RND transporter periplasmic adaptor subunit [Aquisphaera giovannonii]QEH32169.1 ECF RNA polymerase sigma factor SigE [Aquisphaera giovannonii]